jgi:hypothetical protein
MKDAVLHALERSLQCERFPEPGPGEAEVIERVPLMNIEGAWERDVHGRRLVVIP